jgi:hypothetical protein
VAIKIPAMHEPDALFEQFWLSCVKRIARGSNRDVYEIPEHDMVLKVSNRQANFANWSEITAYSHSKNSAYLAKVISWSWSGKYLVMEKLSPVTLNDLNGQQFPNYITDKKPGNFGKDAQGNIKVLDYGMLDLSGCPTKLFP